MISNASGEGILSDVSALLRCRSCAGSSSACDRTRDAVVIDPRRDVDIYVAAAAQSNLKIVAAIETHIHAIFLSGARELAAVGVTTLAGPGASLGFPAREVTHNEEHDDRRPRPAFSPHAWTIRRNTYLCWPGNQAKRRGVHRGHVVRRGGRSTRPARRGSDASSRRSAVAFLSSTHCSRSTTAWEVHPGHGAG